MTHRLVTPFWLIGLLTMAALFTPAAAHAGEAAAYPADDQGYAESAKHGPNLGNLSFTLGTDYVSAYIFRGKEKEDSQLILQPFAKAKVKLLKTDDFSLYLKGGFWNSLHAAESGATDDPEFWFKSKLNADIAVKLLDRLLVEVGYLGHFAPNGNDDDFHEIHLGFFLDDAELWAQWAGFAFALNPRAEFFFEFDDRGGSEDVYAELGIAPAWLVIDGERFPVTFTLPVTLGLSPDDAFKDSSGDNEFFGFVSIGFLLSTDLAGLIPKEFGKWTLTAGYELFVLNEDANLNKDSGTSESLNHVARLGVKLKY